jgi:hypothetical protein
VRLKPAGTAALTTPLAVPAELPVSATVIWPLKMSPATHLYKETKHSTPLLAVSTKNGLKLDGAQNGFTAVAPLKV